MEEALPVFQPTGKKARSDVLELEGEIDLHVSPQVAAELRTMILRKSKVVVVDLAKVTYLDSSGLAVLIEAMQDIQTYGGKFGLADVNESVQYLFEQAKLDQLFHIFPDVETALAAQ